MTRLPFPLSGSALLGLRVEGLQLLFERLGREFDVDEARPRDHRLADQRRFAQAGGDLLGDRARIGLCQFRRRQSAVALEFGEVRAVGDRHLPAVSRTPSAANAAPAIAESSARRDVMGVLGLGAAAGAGATISECDYRRVRRR